MGDEKHRRRLVPPVVTLASLARAWQSCQRHAHAHVRHQLGAPLRHHHHSHHHRQRRRYHLQHNYWGLRSCSGPGRNWLPHHHPPPSPGDVLPRPPALRCEHPAAPAGGGRGRETHKIGVNRVWGRVWGGGGDSNPTPCGKTQQTTKDKVTLPPSQGRSRAPSPHSVCPGPCASPARRSLHQGGRAHSRAGTRPSCAPPGRTA